MSPEGAAAAAALTPKRVVEELDRHVVGQADAKRAVAVALRNRWRRQQLPADERTEVTPRNILMIGPTGVGKTEIARRLAKLVRAPFVKVEATKYTEVGYVGKDVESMIRDLVETGISMVKQERLEGVRSRATAAAEERLLDVLEATLRPSRPRRDAGATLPLEPDPSAPTRDRLRADLRSGALESRQVEIDVAQSGGPAIELMGPSGAVEGIELQVGDAFRNLFPQRSKRRKVPVSEARRIFEKEEAEKLLDHEEVTREALSRVQETGIVFLDELDKIAGRESVGNADVSRQGVQRDLLPLVEGTSVHTKHGTVQTDHILFVAAGAFHSAKPSDLIPELQGRFPIRVELQALTRDDFRRILREPRSSLVHQATLLLATEGVNLAFTDDAVDAMADFACQVNERTEDIGARRLQTVLERVLEEVSFHGPDLAGQRIEVNATFVRQRLEKLAADEPLSRYIL